MNIPADFVKESDRQRLHHLELTKKDLEWSLQRTAHDFGVTFNDDDRALFEHALRAANTLTGRTDLTPGKVMSVAFDPWAIPGSGKWCVCVSFWTSLNWAPAYADVSPEGDLAMDRIAQLEREVASAASWRRRTRRSSTYSRQC